MHSRCLPPLWPIPPCPFCSEHESQSNYAIMTTTTTTHRFFLLVGFVGLGLLSFATDSGGGSSSGRLDSSSSGLFFLQKMAFTPPTSIITTHLDFFRLGANHIDFRRFACLFGWRRSDSNCGHVGRDVGFGGDWRWCWLLLFLHISMSLAFKQSIQSINNPPCHIQSTMQPAARR